jgi:hypothetical protein
MLTQMRGRGTRLTRMTHLRALRSRLENPPTDLRQYTCYFGDRTLGRSGFREETRSGPLAGELFLKREEALRVLLSEVYDYGKTHSRQQAL